jgi:hypothetical protein
LTIQARAPVRSPLKLAALHFISTKGADMHVRITLLLPLSTAATLFLASSSWGATYDVTVNGSDAIFLAGRTDVVIPDPSQPWNTGTFLKRHPGPTPEEIKETLPPSVALTGGDIVRVLDPAVGGVNFFNGFGPPFFGPSGNVAGVSNIFPLDGISGYIGPQGALAGVFLSAAIPSSGPPPATLDFSASGLGTNQATLSPLLNQVFYIGNGLASGASFKEFVAPAGATRLFLGIPDGFGFLDAPGAYDDNDGAYHIVIGVNQTPTVPEPQTYALMALGFTLVAGLVRRRKS